MLVGHAAAPALTRSISARSKRRAPVVPGSSAAAVTRPDETQRLKVARLTPRILAACAEPIRVGDCGMCVNLRTG